MAVDFNIGSIKDEEFFSNRPAGASHDAAANVSVVETFQRISAETGNAVQVLPDYGNVLALTGKDGEPVLLYQFVEEVDSIIDYDELKAAFPNLSFAQIASALSFLRKVCQFNTKGVDIDALEDADLEKDEAFKALVTASVSEPEVSRVLHP